MLFFSPGPAGGIWQTMTPGFALIEFNESAQIKKAPTTLPGPIIYFTV
jgi:hypothetical protein